MSSTAPPEAVPQAPTRAARAGALMAISTLAMAGASAIQAVLYLGEYGATARTDAFFAAFAVYQVVGVFTQATRVSSVPLLVGDKAIGMLRFFGGLAVIALPIIVACGPLAGPLADLLAPSATGSAHDLAVSALRVLGVAIVLQLFAAGAATLLGMRDRFEPVAAAYAFGALAGLVVFLFVRTQGELSLAWSMLAMAVVTSTWAMVALLRVRREEVASGTGGLGLAGVERKQRLVVECFQTAGDLLGRSVVYFVINAFFLVTLAVVGREGGAGATTVLSYAYLLASYLVAGTSTAVGISRAPDMVRGAQDQWKTVVADTVPHGYRYAALVSAPILAAGVVAATPVVDALLPTALGEGQAEDLARYILLLGPWLAAALVLNFAIPALFALSKARLVNVLAPFALALHAAASVAGAAIAGVEGAIVGMFVAPFVFGVVLVVVGAGNTTAAVLRELALDTLRAAGLAAVAFGAGAAVSSLVGAEELLAAVVSLGLGGVLYGAGMLLLAPRAVQVLLGAGRGGGAESSDAPGAGGVDATEATSAAPDGPGPQAPS
ncbi:MAG: hypothetical protein JHD16_13525 [Solirubrobacteraceae bacterium]|nr:hypothetical protein [Solirubrobacteraceae bacterium]